MSIFDNSSDSGMKDLATWLQLLNQISKNQDTSAQDLRVFNMEKSTNDQTSSMIDGLTNEEQFKEAEYLVNNNISSHSPNLNTKVGAQENINKYKLRKRENEIFNEFMDLADDKITEIDNANWDWKNFTISDYVNSFNLYNNFQDATNELQSQTNQSTGVSQETLKPLNYTYQSTKTGRGNIQISNRMNELKGNLDAALVALRNDGIIDDGEVMYVVLGDAKGLENKMKQSVSSTHNNIKYYQKKIGAVDAVLDNFRLWDVKEVIKDAKKDGDVNLARQKLREKLNINALFDQFEGETINEHSEYFGQDARSQSSNDFKKFFDDIVTKGVSLTPEQFEASLMNKSTEYTNLLNSSYTRWKFLTGVDYDARSYSLKAQYSSMINQLLVSTRGETAINPWLYTIDDNTLPLSANVAYEEGSIGAETVEQSNFQEGESYYSPEIGFFKIGSQEDITRQSISDEDIKAKGTKKEAIKIEREKFIVPVGPDNSIINIAKEEGIQIGFNKFKDAKINEFKDTTDTNATEFQVFQDASNKFEKTYNTTIAKKAELQLLWNNMSTDEKKLYGSFSKFLDTMITKYDLNIN